MDPDLIVEKMLSQDLFSQWLNIKLIYIKAGECKLQLQVNSEMTNGFKIAHGGVCFSLADSCLAFAANAKGNIALTKESTIKYFRKVEDGETLFAHGFEKKSREGTYQVNVTNQNKENVAEFIGLIHYTSSKWSN